MNMKKLKNLFAWFFCVVLLLLPTLSHGQWLIDHEHHYKINVPTTWTQETYMDGSDKIADLLSADGNVAIQIRSFAVDQSVDAKMLATVFDEGMQAEGASRLELSPDEFNGMPCYYAIYANTIDGLKVGVVSVSLVQNNIGYLIFSVIPAELFDQRAADADQLLNTFEVISASGLKKSDHPHGGLGDLAEKKDQQTQNSTPAAAGENYVRISSSDRNGTYHFSKSGSYPIKWNSVTVIRGLDANGHLMLEAYLRNHKGTGTFAYSSSSGNSSGAVFDISTVNGLSVRGGSASGEMQITEYQMGGRIKGHFKAIVNGRNIEGKFNLSLPTPKDFNGDDVN